MGSLSCTKGHPLRTIVSGIDSVTYRVAKVIANILKSLVGNSQHNIHNR